MSSHMEVVVEKEERKDEYCNNEDGGIAEAAEKEEEFESAKANMGMVREENERLKLLLSKTVRDYQSLQTHFFDILQQDDASSKEISLLDRLDISLSLGRDPKNEETKTISVVNNRRCNGDKRMKEEGLELGLGFQSVVSEENLKKDDKEKIKEMRQPSREGGEDEAVLQQPQLKKTRVCIRARCDMPTMNDGCQWRKYGQKIAKGNPCPRAYYRCTGSPTCPVRKQVQRCVDDTTILITTYEGTHNHPLQTSATAIASATSAAASMATSSSSSISASQYFPPHTSSFSTSTSHPTITLDLTAPNQYTPNTSQHPDRKLPSNPFPSPPPSSASLSFSSFHAATVNTNAGVRQLNFGAFPDFYNRNSLYGPADHLDFGGLMTSRQAFNSPGYSAQQSLNTDAIAAVITSNPSLCSALAAAFTTYVGRDHHHRTSRTLFHLNNSSTTTQSSFPTSTIGFGSSNGADSDHRDINGK